MILRSQLYFCDAFARNSTHNLPELDASNIVKRFSSLRAEHAVNAHVVTAMLKTLCESAEVFSAVAIFAKERSARRVLLQFFDLLIFEVSWQII